MEGSKELDLGHLPHANRNIGDPGTAKEEDEGHTWRRMGGNGFWPDMICRAAGLRRRRGHIGGCPASAGTRCCARGLPCSRRPRSRRRSRGPPQGCPPSSHPDPPCNMRRCDCRSELQISVVIRCYQCSRSQGRMAQTSQQGSLPSLPTIVTPASILPNKIAYTICPCRSLACVLEMASNYM